MPPPVRVAALAMYRGHPALAKASDRLWFAIRDRLRARGMEGVPERLDVAAPHDAPWRDPGLLLAQTCGYPYMRELRGRVRLVATPTYGAPGCQGPTHCSYVVVRRDAPVRHATHLEGLRAAINDPGSNSGANLFRAFLAPHARGRRFFASVLRTGSHAASLAAVSTGRADVAAIDCVTFNNILRLEPDRLAEVRVLAETPRSPGLPLITAATTTDEELQHLRHALAAAAIDPALAPARATLGLTGFAILAADAYAEVARLERRAVVAGYPAIG